MSLEHELIDALADMVNQHCIVRARQNEPGKGDRECYFDSMALTANASAIRLLIRLGYMKAEDDGVGRRVIAEHFTDKLQELEFDAQE